MENYPQPARFSVGSLAFPHNRWDSNASHSLSHSSNRRVGSTEIAEAATPSRVALPDSASNTSNCDRGRNLTSIPLDFYKFYGVAHNASGRIFNVDIALHIPVAIGFARCCRHQHAG